jgi:hypothetical protein
MPDWKIWQEEDLAEGRSGGRMIWIWPDDCGEIRRSPGSFPETEHSAKKISKTDCRPKC